MKITKSIQHTISVKESKPTYSDYDSELNCHIGYEVIESERIFFTYVTEYVKNNAKHEIDFANGEEVLTFANACITAMLSKASESKMIEIYNHRGGRRKADYEDMVSVFALALLENSKTESDFQNIVHLAYLSLYNSLYALGTKGGNKNPRYGMQSLDCMLYTESGEEVTRQDKALICYACMDKVNLTAIDFNGVTVSKKYLYYLKERIERQLSERQVQIFNYLLEGMKKTDIADCIGIARKNVYKHINTIESVIAKEAEGLKTFAKDTKGGSAYKPLLSYTSFDNYGNKERIESKEERIYIDFAEISKQYNEIESQRKESAKKAKKGQRKEAREVTKVLKALKAEGAELTTTTIQERLKAR